MEIIPSPSNPIYSNGGPQRSLEPERIPTPEIPRIMSFRDTTIALSNFVYSFFKLSPTVPPYFFAINHHVFKVVLLGESHGNNTHAAANAGVINYLWKTNDKKLLLFTEDGGQARVPDGQARFVMSDIAVHRWDQVDRPEIDRAYQVLRHSNESSVSEINKMFASVESMHTVLSKAMDLDESIDSLKKNPIACITARTYCAKNSVLELSNECSIINLTFGENLDNYYNSVNLYTEKRDQYLHNLIKENLLNCHDIKICIIAGRDHIIPAIEFLKRENIAFLAMVPTDSNTRNSEKLQTLKQIFNKIKLDVEEMNKLINFRDNIETINYSTLQFKIGLNMMLYVDHIIDIAKTEAKAL